MSAADTLRAFNVALPAGNYVVFANGVIQQGFAPNPSGSSIGFTIYPITSVPSAASNENNIDFAVLHGVTDAPAVDVRVADVVARFMMPTEGSVAIRVYDLSGALITESQVQNVSSGVHAMPVTLNNVATGGYIMVIVAGIYCSALPFAVTR